MLAMWNPTKVGVKQFHMACQVKSTEWSEAISQGEQFL